MRERAGVPVCFWSFFFTVIADSHGVGGFGEALVQELRAKPKTEFQFVASGASAPLQWLTGTFKTPCGWRETSHDPKGKARQCLKLQTPKLSDLLDSQPNRVTVVALGTNIGVDPVRFDSEFRAAKKLAEVAASKSDSCFWVGPPNMTRKPGFTDSAVAYRVSLIQKAIAGRCTFIDSRKHSHYPKKGDGIHYHLPGSKDADQIREAKAWAQGVWGELEASL